MLILNAQLKQRKASEKSSKLRHEPLCTLNEKGRRLATPSRFLLTTWHIYPNRTPLTLPKLPLWRCPYNAIQSPCEMHVRSSACLLPICSPPLRPSCISNIIPPFPPITLIVIIVPHCFPFLGSSASPNLSVWQSPLLAKKSLRVLYCT